EKVEQDIMTRISKKSWSDVNRTMVQFGRDICRPGIPQCWRCPISKWCRYPHKTKKPAKMK
ncbi:MAG TPA: endonuclease III, partial [Patescibacteria group bacterium]|nr:endonuclease III [Patescibacteria group bacterium]